MLVQTEAGFRMVPRGSRRTRWMHFLSTVRCHVSGVPRSLGLVSAWDDNDIVMTTFKNRNDGLFCAYPAPCSEGTVP